MKCFNCGKTIDSDSKFCPFCGKDAASANKDAEKFHSEEGSVDAYFNNRHDLLIEEARKVATEEIFTGVGLAILGGIITWVTYEFNFGVVFLGLIVVGGYMALKGLYHLASPESLLQNVEPENKSEDLT